MGKLNPRHQKILTLLFVVIATSMITSAVFLAFSGPEDKSVPTPTAEAPAEQRPAVQQAAFSFGPDSSWENAIINVNKKVAPAVVYIDTERTVTTNPMVPEFFRDFFGPGFFDSYGGNREYKQQGTGSGFIIRPDGYIVTNYHVVENADKITVNLKGGKKYDAKVIGADKKYDLAIVKINAKNLTYLEMGDSTELQIGQWVVAFGNPYGLHETVTTGIISALNRSLSEDAKEGYLIQTDAAINPGNSGGPLVNLKGEVIGINEAILSNAQNIGFAIPINLLQDNLDALINDGKIAHPTSTTPWLGIYMQDVNADMTSYFNLPFKNGVYVGQVVKDSPADKAGLLPQDIITQLNRKEIKSGQELSTQIQKMKIGDQISLLVWRDEDFKKIDVVLEAKPEDE